MSKGSLYNSLDLVESIDSGIVLLEGDMFNLICKSEIEDGYTELARAKLRQVKTDLDHNNKGKRSAAFFINNDESFQYWCDLAGLDKEKVKQWLYTKEKGRKYNNSVRKVQ